MKNTLVIVALLSTLVSCQSNKNDKLSILGGLIEVDSKNDRVKIAGLIDVDGKNDVVKIAGVVHVDGKAEYVNVGNGAVVVDNEKVDIKAHANLNTKVNISVGSGK